MAAQAKTMSTVPGATLKLLPSETSCVRGSPPATSQLALQGLFPTKIAALHQVDREGHFVDGGQQQQGQKEVHQATLPRRPVGFNAAVAGQRARKEPIGVSRELSLFR